MSNQNLDLIRQKCIEAIEGNDLLFDGKYPTAEKLLVKHYRPIHLADVLLAIEANYGSATLSTQVLAMERWNLRTDDLNQQSDEEITFLADLLR
jgi:hypothetical protein